MEKWLVLREGLFVRLQVAVGQLTARASFSLRRHWRKHPRDIKGLLMFLYYELAITCSFPGLFPLGDKDNILFAENKNSELHFSHSATVFHTLAKMFTAELNALQSDFPQLSSANHKSYPCHLQVGGCAQVSGGDELKRSTGPGAGQIPELSQRTYYSETRANVGDGSRISSEIYTPWSSRGSLDGTPSVAGDAAVGSSQTEPSDFSPPWLPAEHIYPWMRGMRGTTQKHRVASSSTKTGLDLFFFF